MLMEFNKKKVADVLLSVLPFIFFLVMNFVPISEGNAWESWYGKNSVLAYVILSLTLVLMILKMHKKHWFFVWIGFTFYYSSCFVFGEFFGFPSVVSFFHYSPPIVGNYQFSLSRFFMELNLFSVIQIVLLIFTVRRLRMGILKAFYFIFIYYFIYSFFMFEQYLVVSSGDINIWKTKTLVVILNSFLTILFFLFVSLVKKRSMKILACSVFFILSLLVLNIFRLGSMFSSEGVVLMWEYVKYFLIDSKILLYLLMVFICCNFPKTCDLPKSEPTPKK